MNPSTAILIIKALDGLSARMDATAENIANAGTPNYRPLRVSFENALKEAASRGDDAVRQLTFTAEPAAPGSPDGELRLDLELATASATAMRYDALIDIMNRQMQTESLGVKGSS
jgi:flagellar basal-body rod protein FlgB